MSNSMIPQYSTLLFTQVWDNAEDFVSEYKSSGIYDSHNCITDDSAEKLFYLLYARYGNSPLANRDVTQFKYKMFSVIFQYGPNWEKELSVQYALRGLTEDQLREGAEAIHNQAQNPSSAPATDAYSPLTYINAQNATKYKKSKAEAYALLLGLLKKDVTEEFLKRFNICFKKFVSSEHPLIYVSEVDEDDGD